ncbi:MULTISPECIES: FHA domain-containing protein [unclassified Parafrankia]|uniref:FHA domain-containing protein n=1 Tax=unclassified Parafrankia TaxID=2994368 RepID=UPI000DA491CF|nr:MULTISPECIES: FHA domain-containing protein [unclassified Parafrankia]TCJ32888.1 FHA domain-containing protein [Parafrankia sp. BMG5.11]SQD98523.1 FHA domain containing signalling protein [Parafrankia sp. Ea1.12]
MDLSTIRVTTATGTVELTPDRSYVIGRSREADITVQDTKVSRRHVELAPGPDGWTARDLSTNGVWSEGARAKQFAVDGEIRIRLGGLSGPEVLLRAFRPVQRPPAAAAPRPKLDNADAETMLAGQGRRPVPGQAAPPVPAARTPEPVGAGAGSAGAGASAGAGGGAGAGGEAAPRPALSGWLRALPTLVWLAAVGFALGALVALS